MQTFAPSRYSMIAATLLAIAACGSTAKPAPPRPATCDAVAAAVAVQLRDDLFAALAKPAAAPDAFARSLAAQVGASCTGDAWLRATRQCLVDAVDDSAIARCPLTAEQRTHLAAAIEPLADQHTAEVLRDRMCACTASECVAGVMTDVNAWSRHMDAKYKQSDDIPAPLMIAVRGLADCASGLASDTEPASTSAPDDGTTDGPALAPGGATGVPACDRFLVLQDRFIACDKVPPSARGGMKESMVQQKQAWSTLDDPGSPAEARQAASDGCAAGADALIDAAAAMGCSLE